MASLEVRVLVSKEAYELGQGVAKFLETMAKLLADGWQIGNDTPEALQSVMRDLVPAVSGVQAVPDEILNQSEGFAKALALSLVDCFVALKAKK